MTTRRQMDGFVLTTILAVFSASMIAGMVLALIAPQHVTAEPVDPPLQLVQHQPTGAVIATYDTKEKRLKVTEHAPNDLLLCLGPSENDCKLIAAWRDGR